MPESIWIEVIKILGPTIVGIVLTALVTIVLERRREKRNRAREKVKEAEERRKQQLDLFYEKLWLYLDATRNGFRNQRIIRDRLVQLLEKDHDLQPYLSDDHDLQPYKEWGYKHDELFAALYPTMNEEEVYLFRLMRGITENTLFSYNNSIVQLLDKYPEFYTDVPEILKLHDHLNFWLAKYNSVFKDRDDMCLVYVGLKDEKPFPKGIRRIIKEKIAQLRE